MRVQLESKPMAMLINGSDTKTVSPDALLTRYVEKNYNKDGRVWGDKTNELVEQAKLHGVKVEVQSNEDGTALVTVSSADKQKLDALFAQTLSETVKGEQASDKGQQEATRMAADIPKGIYETTRKAIENTINAVPDTLNLVFHEPIGKRSEISFGSAKVGEMYEQLAETSSLKPGEGIAPRLDTSAAKAEFQSELLRHGDGDSVTSAAGAIAPLVVGGALVTPKPPQTFKNLGDP